MLLNDSSKKPAKNNSGSATQYVRVSAKPNKALAQHNESLKALPGLVVSLAPRVSNKMPPKSAPAASAPSNDV